MKKISTLFSFLICLLTTSLFSQDCCSPWAGGINLHLKSPQGILKDNGLTNLYGGSMEAFYIGCNDRKVRFTPGMRITFGMTSKQNGDDVILEVSQNAFATERLYNLHFGIEAVARLVYDDGHIFKPYVELYGGPRLVGAWEELALTEQIDGFDNSSEKVFSTTSTVVGLGIGALIKLSDKVDLNLKVSNEWTGRIDHVDLARENYYSTDRMVSQDTYNHSYSIGVLIRTGCKDSYNSRPRYRRNRTCTQPCKTKTQPIKRQTAIKT